VIKNFEEIKKQLGELVDIVNGFKSELVQLRVVEAILANLGAPPPGSPKVEKDEPDDSESVATAAGKKKSHKKAAKGGTPGTSKPASSKKSPKNSVTALIADGYFSQKRSIGAVVSHLAEKKATTLSQQAVQMALNRLVQNDEMKREKNGEGQYEYFK
jgi:hypothetical protein